MFSSSSSSGNNGGGGGGGGGCGCGTNGNGGTSGIWSSSLKKQQKRPKVPKRGPGVAELEKILREQERTERSSNNNNGEGFSPPCFNLPHHSSTPLKPHRSPPPRPASPPSPPPPMPMTSRPPPPTHIQIAPKFVHLNPPTPPPPMAALYGYNSTLGRNSSGASGLVFPEQALFPMNPSSCDGLTQSDQSANSSSKNLSSESSNPLWSYTALPQKRQSNQYPPTTMKQFLGPGAPNSSSALPTGLHNHVEPPSNQSSFYNCISRNPEEYKMVGMKRPHPSSLDNSLGPSTNFQVSPIFSNFSRPHKSSANDSHMSAVNFTSSNTEGYRDAKWGGPLGFNSRKFSSDHSGGPGHPNFPSFNGTASPVPSPPMLVFQREHCKNNVLPHQVTEDRVEDSYQRSESSSGSDHRPFYSFLEVKDEDTKESTLGSNDEGCDAGSDGVDLSLKL